MLREAANSCAKKASRIEQQQCQNGKNRLEATQRGTEAQAGAHQKYSETGVRALDGASYQQWNAIEQKSERPSKSDVRVAHSSM